LIDCAFCGRSNTAESLYCIDCGKPVGAAADSSSPLSAAPPAIAMPLVGARPAHLHRLSPSIGRRASNAARALDFSLTPHAPVPGGETVSCGWCGSIIEAGLPFCAHCGRRTDAKLTTAQSCVTCGSAIRPELDTFCATCGTSLEADAPATPGAPGPAKVVSKTLPFTAKRVDVTARISVLDEQGEPKRTIGMSEPELTVGRGACDLVFEDDQYLSPIHARLVLREGTLFVRDLGSCNRTWVFIDGPYSLADTDVLLIGSQILEFQRLGTPAAPRADADGTRRVGSLTPTPDIARLSQLRADGSVRDSQYLAQGRTITIGRDAGDWTFPYDQTMSGRHADLRELDGAFIIHDLGSRNGVGVAVRGERALKVGQRVLLGDQVLRVESV
jgi:pSer/pThr/pTyr-binding forkhead associated (FHA) protein